jgi:hypothetical protein
MNEYSNRVNAKDREVIELLEAILKQDMANIELRKKLDKIKSQTQVLFKSVQ